MQVGLGRIESETYRKSDKELRQKIADHWLKTELQNYQTIDNQQ